MNRKDPPEKQSRHKRAAAQLPFARRREVRIIAALVLVFGVLAVPVFLFPSDPPVRVPPERLLTVYSLHRCPCALRWKRALEQQGFKVAVFKLKSVDAMRKKLRTPITARGCHVGSYLDYFLEGHVPAAALVQLSEVHPAASGLMFVTKSSQAIHGSDPDNLGMLVIVDQFGEASPWTVAAAPSTGGPQPQE